MITREKFDFIKKNYGHLSSWAVWGEFGEKSKSGMADLSCLDPDVNGSLLDILNPNVILVALNFSKDIKLETFGNFHAGGFAQDYKTRFALHGSKYWGGYMTDIIKEYPEMDSNKVGNDHEVNLKNIEIFKKELEDIGSEEPEIIAIGVKVYGILSKNLDYSIKQIPHYANHVSKENYRK